MQKQSFLFRLKVSVAAVALLCALENDAFANCHADTIPTTSTFIPPDGFRLCWTTGATTDCCDVYPADTPAPTSTPAPTTTSAPAAAPAYVPLVTPPPSTVCPTDLHETLGYSTINWSGLTMNLIAGLGGILTTPFSTGGQECGTDGTFPSPVVYACANNYMGAVTKNCVLTGYDPPPLLRPDVTINLHPTADNFSPFVKLPTIGTTATFLGVGNTVLSGSCVPPFVANDGLTVKRENDPSVNAPNKCMQSAISNLPIENQTRPALTPCPALTPTFTGCPPPGFTNPPVAPDCSATSYVPNLSKPFGCTTTTLGSYTTPTGLSPSLGTQTFTYCHKNFSDLPQACGPESPVTAGPNPPGCPAIPAAGLYAVPGMKCGGAVPLLDPLPMDAPLDGTILPSCPPDDWCINPLSPNSPAQGKKFRDGAIHIYQPPKARDGGGHIVYPVQDGPSEPNVFNITLAMGKNNLNVGNLSRVVTIPALGACEAAFGGQTGSLVLSQGYIYSVLPASIIPPTGGPACFGEHCDYSQPATTWTSAPYPVDYDSLYQPYGTIRSPQQQWYGNPHMWIPYLDLPPGTQVYLSLQAKGSINFPHGGMVITPTGGLLSVPNMGWIESEGDGSTVALSPGTGYVLNSGGNAASSSHNVHMTIAPHSAAATPPYVIPATPGRTVPGSPPQVIPGTPAITVPGTPAKPDANPCYVQLVPPDDQINQQAVYCQETMPAPLVNHLIANASILITASAIAAPDGTPLPFISNIKETGDCGAQIFEGSTIEPQYCTGGQQFDPTLARCVDLYPECTGGALPTMGPPATCEGTAPVICGEGSPSTCIPDPGTPSYQPNTCNLDFVWCQATQKCVINIGITTSACSNVAPPSGPPAVTAAPCGSADAC